MQLNDTKAAMERFDELMARYLESLDDAREDERYCTAREAAQSELKGFREFCEQEISREERRQLYLKLKAEFEPDEDAPVLGEDDPASL